MVGFKPARPPVANLVGVHGIVGGCDSLPFARGGLGRGKFRRKLKPPLTPPW